MDTTGTVPAPYQGHAKKIAIGSVGMDIGCRNKTTHLCSSVQFPVFLVDDKDIAIRKQQQETEAFWKVQTLKGVADTGDSRGSEQSKKSEDDTIGFNGDQCGKMNAVHTESKGAHANQLPPAIGQWQGEPEKEGKGVGCQ